MEVLSGSQKEEDEEHRSPVEAWEEALSYLEAQGDPYVHTVLWVAFP